MVVDTDDINASMRIIYLCNGILRTIDVNNVTMTVINIHT
jgi:hypothetical protein